MVKIKMLHYKTYLLDVSQVVFVKKKKSGMILKKIGKSWCHITHINIHFVYSCFVLISLSLPITFPLTYITCYNFIFFNINIDSVYNFTCEERAEKNKHQTQTIEMKTETFISQQRKIWNAIHEWWIKENN